LSEENKKENEKTIAYLYKFTNE